jgi:undecaprenyl-diphosphatase
MTIFQTIILGVVQGITEFLPISSSGHLVIVPFLLGWEFPPREAFIFDVLVQVATLVGVIAFFWKDLVNISWAMFKGIRSRKPFYDADSRLGWNIFLATLPAGWVGLVFKDNIEKAFGNPLSTGVELLVTAVLLILAERIGRRIRTLDNINWKDSLFIGAFQALAILPGVSRSGSTISGAMARDLERPAAARFSFIMSIPIMFGAGVVAMIDLLKIPNLSTLLPVYIPGFIAAAVVGYFAIKWLLAFLSRYSLYYFALYCVMLSLITITYALSGN